MRILFFISIISAYILYDSGKVSLPDIVSVLFILFLIFLIPRWFRQTIYKRTGYFRVTQKSLYQLDKGEIGEYLIYQKLRALEKQGGRFLFNLYLPKTRNETTEVDVVLIHPKGFFVIESKNYSGWIFGDETNRTWTQVLPRGRGYEANKERFQNPLRQNATHIKYLKRQLGEQIPMWSLIVFSDDCEFKDVTVSPDTRFKVIQLHELKRLISNIIKTTQEDIFTESQVQMMYEQLYPFSQVDDETKVRHMEEIKKETEELLTLPNDSD